MPDSNPEIPDATPARRARRRGRWFRPSRRQVLQAAAVTAMAGFASSILPSVPRPEHPADLSPFIPRITAIRNRLHRLAHQWAMGGTKALERPNDKQVYAVDVGQFLHYFAMVGDLEPYLILRDYAVKHLIVDDPAHSFTRGFVLWRARPGEPPDASGTTEALRISKALWTGAERFDRPQDRDLAMTILDGYARHEVTDQGVWLIRNYYGFGGGGRFASNTFIIDYDPDYVEAVADWHEVHKPERFPKLKELATNSYKVLEEARAPCGLLYDLLQPEVKTMYFDVPKIEYFSPNDIVQSNNSVATSSTAVGGRPHVARGVYSFLMARIKKIHALYYGRTGVPVNERGIGGSELAGMARLAALLREKVGVVAFAQQGLPLWEWIAAHPRATDSPAWTVSEMLLSMEEILRMPGVAPANSTVMTITAGPDDGLPPPTATRPAASTTMPTTRRTATAPTGQPDRR